MPSPHQHRAIILFDGICNLCHGTVRFIIRRDRNAYFKFASLQSTPGEHLARSFNVDAGLLESMVLIENGQLYRKSTAALRIANKLGFPWLLMYALILVPVPIRDWVYDFVGRRRYQWFGRQALCLVSAPDAEDRFLSSD